MRVSFEEAPPPTAGAGGGTAAARGAAIPGPACCGDAAPQPEFDTRWVCEVWVGPPPARGGGQKVKVFHLELHAENLVGFDNFFAQKFPRWPFWPIQGAIHSAWRFARRTSATWTAPLFKMGGPLLWTGGGSDPPTCPCTEFCPRRDGEGPAVRRPVEVHLQRVSRARLSSCSSGQMGSPALIPGSLPLAAGDTQCLDPLSMGVDNYWRCALPQLEMPPPGPKEWS